MKLGIECIVKAINEPQLDRALEAVYNQTLPFAKITLINGVCPEVLAHNLALSVLEHEWSLWVDGDVILYPDAHETVKKCMDRKSSFIEYGFGLYDTFLQRDICCCAVRQSEFHKKFKYKDIIANDTECAKRMKQAGWSYQRFWREGVIIGTHFDDPDDFQVFRRFYGRGFKAIGKGKAVRRYNTELKNLHASSGDKRYKIALKAFNYAIERKHYPTSKNVEFEEGVYEEWMRTNLQLL